MSAAPLSTLRLAFFGESGSGKTSLIASYFGYQQRHAFEQTHGYRLSYPPAPPTPLDETGERMI
jgi:GTPase SAR1 family protein